MQCASRMRCIILSSVACLSLPYFYTLFHELGRFGQQIRNTCKVLKCGAGEGWKRRNYLLKQVIERKIKGEMEVTRRRGRRRKKLLDDLKDRRGYCHLKEEALDRTMWRNHFRGGFEPVVRQNIE